MFSWEIYKISKNTFLYRAAREVAWGLTSIFRGVCDKNQPDCLQHIPDLAKKGICCRKNPEAATAGVL